jgi:hypothetical protein
MAIDIREPPIIPENPALTHYLRDLRNTLVQNLGNTTTVTGTVPSTATSNVQVEFNASAETDAFSAWTLSGTDFNSSGQLILANQT